MKIPAISTSVPYSYKSNNAVTSNNTKPSFGFGIDYGDDDYLVANNYEHKEGSGSIFEYFRLLGSLFYTLCKERFGSEDYPETSELNSDQKAQALVTQDNKIRENEISINSEAEDDFQVLTAADYMVFMDDDEWY